MSAGPDRERLAFTVHEVRSPVAALGAIADALGTARSDEEAVRKLVGLALGACRGIERLLDDATLEIARVDGVDLVEIATEATSAAALGGARVRLEVSSDIGPLAADPVRLRQALDNLIRNALVHGSTDGEVIVRVHPGEGAALVSVSNGGEGIPPEDQKRIFDPGVRLHRGRPGSGLGLAVVRAVAQGHGGTVAVESAPGEGATFTISLPSSPPTPQR